MALTQAAHAQLINGDFESRTPTTATGDCVTGDAQARFVPDPWTRTGTPDYSTERQISFTEEYHERVDLPGFDPSPAGGCFEGFRSREGLSQSFTIADVSVPLIYTYFYTEYTRPGRTSCFPDIEFRVNTTNATGGTLISTAPNVGTPGGPANEGDWISEQTAAFTPANLGLSNGDTLDVYFGSDSSCLNTWGFIDGVQIVPAAPPLPELDLTKAADDNTDRAVGDTITYTYTAINTGNVDIADVTVSDVHNGSGALSSITIDALTNTSGDSSDDAADNDIDVLAPGDSVTFEATYVVTLADVTAGSDITNTATLTGTASAGTLTNPTASESVSLLTPVMPPPLPPLDPGVCGGVLGEAYLLDGQGIGGEQNYRLASGSATHDPDVFFGPFGAEPGYVKNADGSVTYYFDGEAPISSISRQVSTTTAFGNESAVAGSAADQTDAAEFWRITARVDGVPGESYNFNLDNGNAHEFIHYWLEDSAGNVIDSTLGDPNTANGWLYGTGAAVSTSSANGATSITASRFTPVSYTIPASSTDGIVLLHIMVYDPQVGWGRLNLTDAPECPVPELELTKVADDNTDRAIGETIIYTYTAENTGNIDIADVTVTDVHNGSGTLSPITIDALTNTSGDSSDDAADNAVDVLAPGDSVTFEASYVVTEADVIAGAAVTNTATGTGTPPVGNFTDPTASESVTIAPLSADLSVTKTNTTGLNGEVDQAADTLTSGATTTYTLTVTNNGPDGMSGAVVTDIVGAGLVCPATNPVTLAGDGVPVGSFTVADLTGAGITLGRLEDTEATVLSYDCTVN